VNTETFDRIRAQYPDVLWESRKAELAPATVLRGVVRVSAETAVADLVLASSPIDVWGHTAAQIYAALMAEIDAKSPAAKSWKETASRLREALRSDSLYGVAP
jgi:hypothetical protein